MQIEKRRKMLISFSIILLIGMFAGWLCKQAKLPSLLGMVITGIVIGPYMLNFIDSSVLNISAEIRRIALIIILSRAGLSLDIADLKQVGRPAILMCFVPACFEIIGVLLLAPPLLGISLLDAAIMGAVIAAVSPAVIVPKMLKLMKEGYGTKQGIPQLILAGASVDDVFVIVMFSVFTGLAQGGAVSALSFIKIPLSILSGIAVGILVGFLLAKVFEKVAMRDTSKLIIFLCTAFILVTLEDYYGEIIPFAALISVMFAGIALQRKDLKISEKLAERFNKLWVPAEVFLFVLVGATVDLKYAIAAGIGAVLLIFGSLAFRMLGVALSLVKTPLDKKERLFCMIGYTPKATVQAAIGAIPLGLGLSCGNIVLTVAVLSILITAPLGAFVIDLSYKKLLRHKDV